MSEETQNKHTPLKWEARGREIFESPDSDSDFPIARIYGSPHAAEHIDLIVEAVNSHAALKAELAEAKLVADKSFAELCEQVKRANRLGEQAQKAEEQRQELLDALKGIMADEYWQKRINAVTRGFGTKTPYGQVVVAAQAAINSFERKYSVDAKELVLAAINKDFKEDK